MSLRVDDRTPFMRLQKRFKSPTKANEETPSLSETIVPISNVDELLRNPTVEEETGISTATTGWKVIRTVATGKREVIYAIQVGRETGTVNLTSHIRITKATTGKSIYIFEVGTPAAGVITGMLNQPVVLDQGDLLETYCSTNEAASTIKAEFYLIQEDSF